MLPVVIAIILLFVAVGVVYSLLKKMGEDGIEVASPGSCKSGRCGVRCAPKDEINGGQDEIDGDSAK